MKSKKNEYGSWLQKMGWLWSLAFSPILFIYLMFTFKISQISAIVFVFSFKFGIVIVMLGSCANRQSKLSRMLSFTEFLFRSGYHFKDIILLFKDFSIPQYIICSSFLFLILSCLFESAFFLVLNYIAYPVAFICMLVIEVTKSRKHHLQKQTAHSVVAKKASNPAVSPVVIEQMQPSYSSNKETSSNSSPSSTPAPTNKCSVCGKVVPKDNLIYIDGAYYCVACVSDIEKFGMVYVKKKSLYLQLAVLLNYRQINGFG